jgi:hypothetical protein
MCESMFDAHAFSQLRASGSGSLEDAELLLQPLIRGDADSATLSARGMRALASLLAWATRFGVELDHLARLEMLYLPSGARAPRANNWRDTVASN